LAIKVSFINAIANIAESVGADIEQICAGIGSDSRIGPKFLNPGIGYGGSCFPKEVQAFYAVAKQHNYEFGLLTEVMRINGEQRLRFLKKIKSALWTLRGNRLGVQADHYPPNCREMTYRWPHPAPPLCCAGRAV